MSIVEATTATTWNSWAELAERVLDGYQLSVDDALAVLASPDDELLDVLGAAFRVRQRYFGRTVQLYFLMNAKSGLCPEDCHYCSQSKVSEAEIPRYNLLNREQLLAGAAAAAERHAKTYCIVISARGPNEREITAIEAIVPEIKERYGLDICACLGLLTSAQADRLAACGVNRVNHNLNRRALRRDLHDAHVSGSRQHAASGAQRRHGALLRRHHRHGREAARHRVDGDGAARLGR
jgi:biotin synthase